MKFEIDLTKLNEEEISTLMGIAVNYRVRQKLEEEKPIVKTVKKKYNTNGRYPNHRKSLTLEDIHTIVNRKKEGKTLKEIAKELGRKKMAISSILWQIKYNNPRNSPAIKEWLTQNNNNSIRRKGQHLTNTIKATIIKERNNGNSYEKIAKLVNSSPTTAYNIYEAYKRGEIKLNELGV